MGSGHLKQFVLLPATVGLLLALAVIAPVVTSGGNTDFSSVSQKTNPIPLAFTKNMGQWPDSILFRSEANGATMWFTKDGIYYQFFERVEKSNSKAATIDPIDDAFDALPGLLDQEQNKILTTMIKAEFVGTSKSVDVVGLDEMAYKCNYYIGNDFSKWRTVVPNFRVVMMRGLYPGVDVTFSSHNGLLNAELIASTSEALSQVKVEYRGAKGVTRLSEISAKVHTILGEHTFAGVLLADKLVSASERQFQTATSGAGEPALTNSTYLGGNGVDIVNGTKFIFTEGNIAEAFLFIFGASNSSNFPSEPSGWVEADSVEAFITKWDPANNSLVYSTFLGGGRNDRCVAGTSIGQNKLAVTGETESPDFPTLNPADATLGGSKDMFLSVLSEQGALEVSTYHGGFDLDIPRDIFLKNMANVGTILVVGQTYSSDFLGIGSLKGVTDVILSQATLTTEPRLEIVNNMYLGGSGEEDGGGITSDKFGNIFVIGTTTSLDFPTFLNDLPIPPVCNGGRDVFLTKVKPDFGGMIFSIYLGGSANDYGEDLELDAMGNSYLTGWTQSPNFPTVRAYDGLLAGGSDAYVAKVSPTGEDLVYSTYLGGSSLDMSYGIAVDRGGSAHVTGNTYSIDFPLVVPINGALGGFVDAIVTKLNPTGDSLVFSSYLGGGNVDFGRDIAVDMSSNAYVIGNTQSSNFPTVNPFDATWNGFSDVFLSKLSWPCCVGYTGDVDCSMDGVVDISDLSILIDHMLISLNPLCCPKAGDIDGSHDGVIDIADLSGMIDHMLIGFGPTAPCW